MAEKAEEDGEQDGQKWQSKVKCGPNQNLDRPDTGLKGHLIGTAVTPDSANSKSLDDYVSEIEICRSLGSELSFPLNFRRQICYQLRWSTSSVCLIPENILTGIVTRMKTDVSSNNESPMSSGLSF